LNAYVETIGEKMRNDKRTIAHVTGALLLLLVISVSRYSAGNAQLPPEIKKFYEDLNFVSSFSTPDERGHLALLGSPDLQTKPLPERLRKVQDMIKNINDKIWSVDPGIDTKPVMRYRTGEIPAEFMKIEDVKTIQGSIDIRVKVYSLEPEMNLLLISRYEKQLKEKNTPSLDDNSSAMLNETPRTEIHKSLKINGRWMLRDAKAVLLK
jgi:hypothetical protein